MKLVAALLVSLGACSMARADFTEGFESFTGAGWTFSNQSNPRNGGVSGPAIWRLASDYVHTGARSLFVDVLSGTGVSTISNWAVLPVQMLGNGDTFTFWTEAPFDDPNQGFVFPDRLQVRLSTNGASSNTGVDAPDVGDFTTLLLDINPTYDPAGYPWVWTQFSITISGLSGPTSGRLAFRYFVENGGPSGVNSDVVFIDDLAYTQAASVCYANCDGSTTSPVLNVLDFACFLNRFAAGDSYANCDGSTTAPVLNVLDFACFLNAFAAGCS
jgi:hypothetical protein